MRQKLYEAIDMAVMAGVPVSMLADTLTQVGWPRDIVNQGLDEWLARNSSRVERTDFKTWLKKYQRRAIPAVIVVVIVGLVQAGFMLLRPWPMKIMADSALGTIPAPWILEPYTHTTTLIAITSAMTLLIFLVGMTFSWLSDYLLLKIGFWLNRSIKAESFRHILHLPLFHQERLAKGDYVYRQNVVTNSLSDLVLGSTASIITSTIMIIGVLVIMANFNLRLTIVSVMLMPLLYMTMRLISPHIGKYTRRLAEINSKTASSINEAVDNAETVQAFTLEDKLLLQVDDLWKAGYRMTKSSMMWRNLLGNTNSFLVIIATSVVMFFGGASAMEGKMTFGELFIFMTYMGYLLNPVENLVRRITSRAQKIIDVGRVYEVLSDHEGIEDLRSNRQLPAVVEGVIDFQNISCSYNGAPVFSNLSLHVNRGEKVGIIGPSGGGKSTLLKLVPLFIEPEAGTILIDGVDTQSVSLQGLRQKVAWVSQSPQLFSGSILENIYDGDIFRRVGIDEAKNAVEVANVMEFAVKMPMGINSPVGENGSSLSGGQRQRVSLARSLIREAPILCLDEPTAALDAKSENYIRDSLMQMVLNKTVLMVTHRRALLALMDTIYVLDNGVLTNVNLLGGLDHYLAVLEGIDEQRVAREIADDMIYTSTAGIEESIGLVDTVAPVARSVESVSKPKRGGGKKVGSSGEGSDIAETKQIYTLKRSADDMFNDNKTGDMSVRREATDNEDEEVFISLH